MNISILGAGNMGTALAHVLAGREHAVRVWDHFPEVTEDIRARRENRRFLPGVRLHPGIEPYSQPNACVAGADLVILCVPSAFVSPTLEPLLPALRPDAILLNVAKGFAPGTRISMPDHIEWLAPSHPCVHLAGPAIANELARGLPASVVMASRSLTAARQVAEAFRSSSFLTSTSTDVTGATLGGILKNVYAILLGCAAEIGGGSRNLQATALTASVREMSEIVTACGGLQATISGLAGLGDLAATGSSPDSHNRKFGQALAAGKSAAMIEAETGWLPEGARACVRVCELAAKMAVAAPLAEWVRDVLAGGSPAPDHFIEVLRAANTPR